MGKAGRKPRQRLHEIRSDKSELPEIRKSASVVNSSKFHLKVQTMRKLIRDAVRASLRPLELLAVRGKGNLSFPPIFIVSPPRSGSTLLYLLAAQKFHLGYFSNFSMTCPESPALLTLLGAPFGACTGGSTLENSFGETSGWNAPNQGYRAWNRWFPIDQDYIAPDEIKPQARRRLRQTIATIENATGSPFINKWQRNVTRVRALHATFPEAVFLQLRRDPLLTVQSILSARKRLANDAEWFSARPRSYVPDSGKDHLRQAAEQVALLEMDLEEDKKAIGQDRFFVMRYEDLCSNADVALDAFSSWYASRTGIPLRQRQDLNVALTESKSIRMTDKEVGDIKDVFRGIRFLR